MGYETLDVRTRDGRRLVTIDREGKPNPINRTVLDELDEVLADVDADDEVHVLTVHGAGGAFATGADLSYLDAWFTENRWDEMLRFVRRGQEVCARLDGLSVPTVAVIDGHALGGGLEIALACDFRFASRRAEFGFPEIDLGMIPGWGGTQRLPHLVGESTAKDLVLTARRIDAEEAHSLGLVDRVTAAEELETRVADYVAVLAEKPPETMGYLLEAIQASRDGPVERGLADELLYDVLSSTTDEAQRRTKAFLED